MNLAFILMLIALGLAVLWVIWTVRLAIRARRGPSLSLTAFIKHDAAVGGLSRFVALATLVAASAIFPDHPLPIWTGALAAVLVVGGCETRWPRPSGQLRSAPLVARRTRDLVPALGGVMAIIGLLAATAVVGFCWIRGDSPSGRKIGQNIQGVDGNNYVQTAEGFPGWPVGLLAAAGFLMVMVAAVVVSRVIAGRAALPGVEPSMDLLLRRAAMDRLLRTLAVLGFVTTAEFYTAARSAFGNLFRLVNPQQQMPADSFYWIPAVCWILAIASMELGRVRPPRRAKVLTSA